jgi:hypothetical protein
MIPMTTLQSISARKDSLLTEKLWIDYSTGSSESFTTITTPNINSTTDLPTSSFTSKTTLPSPTPWYPPAGLFDWWEWQKYTTNIKKMPSETPTSTQQSITTIVTTNSTTRKNPINITSILTRSRKKTTTTNFFKWPYLEFTSTIKSRSDYDEEEYNEWLDYFSTTKIPSSKTANSFGYIPLEKQRKKFQQMSYLLTKSNDQFSNHLVTHLTPTTKRHSTLPYTNGISERNAVGNQVNGKRFN